MNDATPQASFRPELLAFDIPVTLEDMVALHLRSLASPAMRAGWQRRAALTVVLATAFSPLALAAGVFLAWTSDSASLPYPQLLRSLLADTPFLLPMVMLAMAVCTAAGLLVQRATARSRLRRVLGRILRARPDVDPADSNLSFPAHVTVSETGMESRSAVGSILLNWAVLKRWEETPQHILVLGDAMIGIGINTSATEAATLDRLRAILAARLGPPART